jgi:hypothetical protein
MVIGMLAEQSLSKISPLTFLDGRFVHDTVIGGLMAMQPFPPQIGGAIGGVGLGLGAGVGDGDGDGGAGLTVPVTTTPPSPDHRVDMLAPFMVNVAVVPSGVPAPTSTIVTVAVSPLTVPLI